MTKPVLYSIFVIKFLFGLSLIIWTIYKTFQANIENDIDNAFLSSYHNVDENYNKMVINNQRLNHKYNIKFKFNNHVVHGVTVKDVFLSQRAIFDRKIRKSILKPGVNNFKVDVLSNETNNKVSAKINMLVTMATTHDYDKHFEFQDGENYKFDLKQIGFWNITGTILIDDVEGYFFIKTDAK